jgi:predicted pyridoxine 5'-phosphate oxidase superfamily flavin-nucleotide-binding protein
MAKQFASMTPAHRDFIARQRIFFTASATSTSRVNVSPARQMRYGFSMSAPSPIST